MKHRSFALFFLAAAFLFCAAPASAQQTPPPACTLSSSAGVVQKGGTVNLRWSSANAVSGSITSIGSVGPSGIQGVIPTQTTEYVGLFTGPGGTARCSVTIIVTLPGGGTTIPTGATGGEQVQTTGTQTTGAPEGGNSAFPQSPSLQSGQPAIQSSTGGLVPCKGTDCQACHVASLVQNVIKFLIMLTVPIAALLFAVAGAMYFSTEITNKKEQAKKIIQKGIIGLIIALSAWLVVNTVFYVLFDQQQFSGWSSLKCVDNRQVTGGSIQNVLNRVLGAPEWTPQGTPVAACPSGYPNISESGQCCNAQYTQCVQQPACEAGYVRTSQGDCYNAQNNSYASPVVPSPVIDGATYNDAAARQALLDQYGITVNKTQSQGTSLDGVNQSLIETLGFVKGETNLNLIVSGGSENGHQNSCHKNGTCVDVSCPNCNVSQWNSLIQSTQQRGYCAVYEPGGSCPAGVSPCLPNVGTGPHVSFYMSPSQSPSCNR